MIPKSISISHKIVEARKKKNLSQAELARQIFITAQAVGKWERGESLPDIAMLIRLAEILGVDLNYFSENFEKVEAGKKSPNQTATPFAASQYGETKRPGWDFSKLNLSDSDFSGLKNLHEKINSSNLQRCLFVGSEMSGLILNSNNVEGCDFSNSTLSASEFQHSMLSKCTFTNCALQSTKFKRSFVEGCDFTGADFTKAAFTSGGFEKNTLKNAQFNGTTFIEMAIRDVVFEDTLTDCHFENCSFNGVKFQNATLINTFFKNNKKFKRVQFINCKADTLTFAFLKNNLADLAGITLIS